MTRLSRVETPDGQRPVNPALVSQRQARSLALAEVETLLQRKGAETARVIAELMLPGCVGDPCPACAFDAAHEDASGDQAAEREPAEEEA